MELNYDYLAGLIDGEGSFVVTISPRKRKTGKITVVLYMWITIGQSYHDGRELITAITKWLNKQGIKTFIMKPYLTKSGVLSLQLRIAEIHSLRLICHRLNGKLILKQEALENFAMILEMRWARWNSRSKHKGSAIPLFIKEKEDFYRTVAIIWDAYREKRHHRSWKKSLEKKYLDILEMKKKTLKKNPRKSK